MKRFVTVFLMLLIATALFAQDKTENVLFNGTWIAHFQNFLSQIILFDNGYYERSWSNDKIWETGTYIAINGMITFTPVQISSDTLTQTQLEPNTLYSADDLREYYSEQAIQVYFETMTFKYSLTGNSLILDFNDKGVRSSETYTKMN